MRTLATACLTIAAALGGMLQTAQESQPGTTEIKALAGKYQMERAHVVKMGIDKRFPPALLSRADESAKRGEVALQEGRFLQAREAFRQARWQLPYQAFRLPNHVARVLGNTRLRHAGAIHAV